MEENVEGCNLTAGCNHYRPFLGLFMEILYMDIQSDASLHHRVSFIGYNVVEGIHKSCHASQRERERSFLTSISTCQSSRKMDSTNIYFSVIVIEMNSCRGIRWTSSGATTASSLQFSFAQSTTQIARHLALSQNGRLPYYSRYKNTIQCRSSSKKSEKKPSLEQFRPPSKVRCVLRELELF